MTQLHDPTAVEHLAVTDDDHAELRSTGSVPDLWMRRLLHVPDGQPRMSSRQAQRSFSFAMGLSGLRCLFSYVLFPFVFPILGLAAGAKSAIGVPIAAVALVFDVRGIRRVWLAGYPRRWAMSALYLAVMVLVTVLLVENVVSLLS